MSYWVVYWIHLESHIDKTKEGYIGVAQIFEQRMGNHLRKTSKLDSHFGRSIRLYGWHNLIKEVIFTGTKEECFELERSYRPDFQIGWNEAIGGNGGDRSHCIDYKKRAKPIGNKLPKNGELNPFFGKMHSKESKSLMSSSKSKSIIYTPNGPVYGFNNLAKILNVHKQTAKKVAIENGWTIQSKQEMH